MTAKNKNKSPTCCVLQQYGHNTSVGLAERQIHTFTFSICLSPSSVIGEAAASGVSGGSTVFLIFLKICTRACIFSSTVSFFFFFFSFGGVGSFFLRIRGTFFALPTCERARYESTHECHKEMSVLLSVRSGVCGGIDKNCTLSLPACHRNSRSSRHLFVSCYPCPLRLQLAR